MLLLANCVCPPLGLRFTRALCIMKTPDVLIYLNLVRYLSVKTSNGIRLCQLVSTLISVWFAAAGLIHLVGDVRALQLANATRVGSAHCTASLAHNAQLYCDG